MVSPAKRVAKLRSRLLDIRLGPGAAVLSRDVTRIHMEYARFWNDGHMGPRKFRRQCLPRLKYHNPAIAMSVNVIEDQAGPATMTVYFAPKAVEDGTVHNPSISSSETAEGKSLQDDQLKTRNIDMKHKKDSEILKELLEMADGQPIFAKAEEEAELKRLEERNRMIEADKARVEEIKKKENKRLEVLRRAREAA